MLNLSSSLNIECSYQLANSAIVFNEIELPIDTAIVRTGVENGGDGDPDKEGDEGEVEVDE